MRLTITIWDGSAAFDKATTNGDEIARILRHLANEMQCCSIGPDPHTGEPAEDVLRDSSGKACGKVRAEWEFDAEAETTLSPC